MNQPNFSLKDSILPSIEVLLNNPQHAIFGQLLTHVKQLCNGWQIRSDFRPASVNNKMREANYIVTDAIYNDSDISRLLKDKTTFYSNSDNSVIIFQPKPTHSGFDSLVKISKLPHTQKCLVQFVEINNLPVMVQNLLMQINNFKNGNSCSPKDLAFHHLSFEILSPYQTLNS